MQGVAAFLQRARAQNLMDAVKPSNFPENDENLAPFNANRLEPALESLNKTRTAEFQDVVKPVFTEARTGLHKAVQDLESYSDSRMSETVKAHAVEPRAETPDVPTPPAHTEGVYCLPGMDEYRDIVLSDSESENDSENEEEPLSSLAKKLSLNPRNSECDETIPTTQIGSEAEGESELLSFASLHIDESNDTNNKAREAERQQYADDSFCFEDLETEEKTYWADECEEGEILENEDTFFGIPADGLLPRDDLPHIKASASPPRKSKPTPSKAPKTEAPERTRSRVHSASKKQLPSPLVGVCRAAQSAQLGAMTGSRTVPVKSRSTGLRERHVYAVADTNVLLQNLELVENTRNYQNLTLVIPTAVVRELDGLKNGQALVAKSARTALHSLRRLVKDAGSRSSVRFQNEDEVPKSRSFRGHTRSNDDRILDCCLYYTEAPQLKQGRKVVLLTNDVALQVKAESCTAERLITAMGMRAFYATEVWNLQ